MSLATDTDSPLTTRKRPSDTNLEEEQAFVKQSRQSDASTDGRINASIGSPIILNAAQTATLTAAQTAIITAQTVAHSAAQTATQCSNTEPSQIRSAEEDALSLYGGNEFDQPEDCLIGNTDLLTTLDNLLLPSDETGPPISEQLAQILSQKYNAEFDMEKRKEIMTKYKLPKNCDTILVPRVNNEIWGKLNVNARRNDLKMSALQDTLLRVTSALAISADDLLTAREKGTPPDYPQLIAKFIDLVALIGHVNKEISYKRRDMLRPNLNNDFKQACAREIKPGKFLFGDDLPQVVQQLRATSKIVQTVNASPQQHSNRFRPRPMFMGFSSPGASTQSRPFLAQRGRMQYPPRMQSPHRNYYNQQQSPRKKNFTKH
eukprot:gene20798-22838_t